MSGSSNLNSGFLHKLSSTFSLVRDKVTKVPTVSKFEKERTLTPEEFVKAGDYLVNSYPSWQWYSGVPSKRKDYLTQDKQCLVTRRVPVKSPTELQIAVTEEQEEQLGDEFGDWLIPKMALQTTSKKDEITPPKLEQIRSIDDSSDEEDDDDVVTVPELSNRRTYDLFITYDKYYQVPRVWLVGFDSAGNPLTAEQVCEDISKDHAGATVTWDAHPHEDFPAASIHPCRHAEVMKSLLDTMESDGKAVCIDRYLLTFLKFITALIPTIEYDYSVSI